MVKKHRFNCMVTMQSWMFLSSFEKMREKVLQTKSITNLMHMENMVMGIAFGTAVTIFRNDHVTGYKGTYNQIKLQDIENGEPKAFPVPENRFAQTSTDNFSKIPGSPVAYWLSNTVFNLFNRSVESIRNYAFGEGKNVTTNNAKYILFAWEVNKQNIGAFNYKWLPCAMGGDYRKWYGNIVNVIDWSIEARNFYKTNQAGRIIREEYWNMSGVTWGKIGSSLPSFRYLDTKQMYQETAVLQKNIDDSFWILSVLNTKVAQFFLSFLAPTINFQLQDICAIPLPANLKEIRNKAVQIGEKCVKASKDDWDSYETSWDFKRNPLI